jgi:hypothetical protein
MLEAEDAPAAYAGAPFDEVDASAALVTVGREVRVTKEFEYAHRGSSEQPADAERRQAVATVAFRGNAHT